MRIVDPKPVKSFVGIGEEFDVRTSISSRVAEELAELIRLVIVKAEREPEVRRDARGFDAGRKCADRIDVSFRRIGFDQNVGAVVDFALTGQEVPESIHGFGGDLEVFRVPDVNVVVSEFE